MIKAQELLCGRILELQELLCGSLRLQSERNETGYAQVKAQSEAKDKVESQLKI